MGSPPADEVQISGVELEIRGEDVELASVPPTAYRVSQLPGGGRGYVIEEFDQGPGDPGARLCRYAGCRRLGADANCLGRRRRACAGK